MSALLAYGLLAIQPSNAGAATLLAKPLAPSVGVLFGAWVDLDGRWTNVTDAMNEVTSFEQAIGRKLDINQHYYSWQDKFPTSLETWDRTNGRLPLITWEAWGTNLDAINSGSHDGLIRTRARDVKAFGTKVLFRWGHEMNSTWYPWAGSKNGKDPAKYIAAYRRIHGIFRSEGATNAAFIWSPNNVSVPNESWNHWSKYYPGDAYVDWVGPDGYNWGTKYSWSKWESFATLFRPIYKAYASRKPLIIPETGSVTVGGSQANWIADMWKTIAVEMPRIKALLWFNAPITALNTQESYLAITQKLASHQTFNQEVDTVRPKVLSVSAYRYQTRRFKLVYRYDEPARSAVKVVTRSGTLVRVLRGWGYVAPRYKVAYWDGRDYRGRIVKRGTYYVTVAGRDRTGNGVKRYKKIWVP